MLLTLIHVLLPLLILLILMYWFEVKLLFLFGGLGVYGGDAVALSFFPIQAL